MYSNRPALSNTFRKKIKFYAATAVGSIFRCGKQHKTGPFPEPLVPPGRNRRMVRASRQHTGKDHAEEKSAKCGRGIASCPLQATSKKGSRNVADKEQSAPSRYLSLVRARRPISAIKKRAPASLEPVCSFMVGMARFERAASASRTLRSSQTEPHPVAREDITPKGYRMQAFFSKKFLFTHFLPSSFLPSIHGQAGKRFVHIRQLGFDFMKKGAKTHIPVRLPGKNFFEVALCRTQVPRTILATARS